MDSLYFRDGSKPENDWKEFYGLEDVPHVINPKEGYIVTCNNRINGGSDFNSLGTTMPTSTRAVRANNLLKAKIAQGGKVTLDFFKAMQGDVLSEMAKKQAPLFLSLANQYKQQFFALGSAEMKVVDKVVRTLEGWNGSYDADSKQALVFNAWERSMHDMMLLEYYTDPDERSDVLGSFFIENFLGKFATEWINGKNLASDLCRNEANKDSKMPCIYNLLHSLLSAHSYIVNKFGSDEVTLCNGIAKLEMEERPHNGVHAHTFQRNAFASLIPHFRSRARKLQPSLGKRTHAVHVPHQRIHRGRVRS